MNGYAFHPKARADLSDIWEYIQIDSIDAADRVVNEILARISHLVAFPQQGFRRPEITSLPLRFVVVRRYLIAYAPDQDPLWVIAVLHGMHSPRVLAAILRERTSTA